MSAPLVSVIVPNYNHARYLDRRVRSVLEQTLRDCEVLILDDASTDGSLRVLERYRDEGRIRLFTNQTNSGSPFPQWNRGVGLARGTYVWIAESDDEAEPRMLETLVGTLEASPDVVLAYCQSWVIDDEGRRLHTAERWAADLSTSHWTTDRVTDGRDELAERLVIRCTIPNASGVVFRRDAYLAAGGAPEDMRLAGDWMTWARLLLQGRVAFVAEPLNGFRYHGATVRATTPKAEFCRQMAVVQSFICRHVAVPRAIRRLAIRETRREWWHAVRISHVPLRLAWRVARTIAAVQQSESAVCLGLFALGRLKRSAVGPAVVRVKRFLTGHRDEGAGMSAPS